MNEQINSFLINDDASSLSKFLIAHPQTLLDGYNYLNLAKEMKADFCVFAIRNATERFLIDALSGEDKSNLGGILRAMQQKSILDIYSELVKEQNILMADAVAGFKAVFSVRAISTLKSIKKLSKGTIKASDATFLDNYLPLVVDKFENVLLRELELSTFNKKNQAVIRAMNVIYFNDSADYLSSLYSIVSILDPGGFKIVMNKPQDIFKYTQKLEKMLEDKR